MVANTLENVLGVTLVAKIGYHHVESSCFTKSGTQAKLRVRQARSSKNQVGNAISD